MRTGDLCSADLPADDHLPSEDDLPADDDLPTDDLLSVGVRSQASIALGGISVAEGADDWPDLFGDPAFLFARLGLVPTAGMWYKRASRGWGGDWCKRPDRPGRYPA